MDNLQLRQPVLPIQLQKELDQQLARISQIDQAVYFALESVNGIYRKAVFEEISAAIAASIFKKAAEANVMTPELEAHFKQLQQYHFNVMEQIPKEACEKIIHTLKEIDVDKEEVGLVAEIKKFFQQLLNE